MIPSMCFRWTMMAHHLSPWHDMRIATAQFIAQGKQEKAQNLEMTEMSKPHQEAKPCP